MKCLPNQRPTVKQLDRLWNKVIKLRAKGESEYKHIPDSYLAAHHIVGKITHALRYNLDNGVCITVGQHKFVAHHTGRAKKFKEWALKKRGVYEEDLELTAYNQVDRFLMKEYLERKIKEYE